ncbi:MAG: hypothetical protein H6619_05195 [Deltaproteobacteria bacterium]|nr:hypothetical protein [Deltaproteobacteria bacterium]
MEQIEIIRRLTPQQRLEQAFELYQFARKIKEAALRKQNPTLSDQEIKVKLRDIFLYAQS